MLLRIATALPFIGASSGDSELKRSSIAVVAESFSYGRAVGESSTLMKGWTNARVCGTAARMRSEQFYAMDSVSAGS
jgi:hypothetical protein